MPAPTPAPPLRVRHRRAYGSCSKQRVADPLLLLEVPPTELEPVLRARPVPGYDRLELGPIGLGVLPHALVVSAQVRVRHRQAELPDLRHVPLEELLPSLLVALRLDPPEVHRILVARDRVAV